jgi:hypothetical protein
LRADGSSPWESWVRETSCRSWSPRKPFRGRISLVLVKSSHCRLQNCPRIRRFPWFPCEFPRKKIHFPRIKSSEKFFHRSFFVKQVCSGWVRSLDTAALPEMAAAKWRALSLGASLRKLCLCEFAKIDNGRLSCEN